jgi:hypothetical protein
MPKNSVLQICSLILNLKTVFEKNRKVKYIHRNIGKVPYERSHEYSQRHYKRIYNDIENGFYSYEDLWNFICVYYLFEDKLKLSDIQDNAVKDASYILSNDRYVKDADIMNNAIATFDTSSASLSYDILFEPNDIGTSYAYELVIEGVISPIFFIKNLVFYEKNRKVSKESKEYSKFVKKIYYITYILNEAV